MPDTLSDREIVVRTTRDSGDLEKDLRFAQMRGTERMNQPYSYTLECLSPDLEHDPMRYMGEPITVEVRDRRTGEAVRHFSGIVESFAFTGMRDRFGVYEIHVVPALYYLSKRHDNRIFQELTVLDIFEQVYSGMANTRFETRLTGTPEPRPYCVQYGESDLAFVNRLLEDEGIFYFFEHGDGEHTMILCNDVSRLTPAQGAASVRYLASAGEATAFDDAIYNLRGSMRALTGRFLHADYDFEKASSPLASPATATTWTSDTSFPGGQLERYEYPGKYTEPPRGDRKAQMRLDELQSHCRVVSAECTARAPMVGSTLDVTEYPRERENGTYFIEAAAFELADGEYIARAESGGEDLPSFAARYTLIPVETAYRPPRVTPWPVMRGPQTAVVLGPADRHNEEIHTDQYSRVKVKFHWDRLGADDGSSSCWVRVSAAWAGSGSGFVQIPRIGHEVIVDFLEGDPDQPIVTGRVYNSDNMPPHGLPGSATKSTWYSLSSPGGGGHNELTFEDKAGEEEVYFHAQKDHREEVLNDETRDIYHDWVENVHNNATQWVGAVRRETVDSDKFTEVKGHRQVNIRQTDTEEVDRDRTLTVHGRESITVDLDSTEEIKMNHKQTVGLMQSYLVKAGRSDKVGLFETRAIGAYQSLTVGLYRNYKVGSTQSRYVQSNDTFVVNGNKTLTVNKDDKTTVKGMQDVSVTKDGTYMAEGKVFWHSDGGSVFRSKDSVKIESEKDIEIVVGQARLMMKKDGTISINGKDITLDASGAGTFKADKDVKIKGKNVNHN